MSHDLSIQVRGRISYYFSWAYFGAYLNSKARLYTIDSVGPCAGVAQSSNEKQASPLHAPGWGGAPAPLVACRKDKVD